MAAHRRLAAEYGHQADAVVRAGRERAQHPTHEGNPQQRVRESVTFSRDKNFEREAVVDERAIVRDALRRGMGEITYAQVRGISVPAWLPGSFKRSSVSTHRAAASSPRSGLLRRSGRFFAECWRSAIRYIPWRRAEAIQVADRHTHLNRAQKSVVEDVLSSPDRIQGIQGYAGTGKTLILATLRSAVEAQAYEVQGFAPTSRAAHQLREAGIEAGTFRASLPASSDATSERKHFYL